MSGTSSCAKEFDTTRLEPTTRGTLGDETVKIVCERVDVGENPGDIDFSQARGVCSGAVDINSPEAANLTLGPKVLAMAGLRAGLANAIDRAIPESLYSNGSVDCLLLRLLPLYGPDGNAAHNDAGVIALDHCPLGNGMFTTDDPGTAPYESVLPLLTRKTADQLGAMANDNDTVAALARASHRQGYRPPRVALGLTRNMLAYSQLGTTLDALLGLIHEPDANGQGQGDGYAHWVNLLDTLRGELARAAPATPADQRNGTTLDATMDLLFRTDSALGTRHPRLLVRRDPHGMARVATNSSGTFPTPFVDRDADGYVDSSGGVYVDRANNPITVPSPFPATDAPDGPRDSAGRALVQGSQQPMYQYLDVDQTVLAQLMRDSRSLVDPMNNTALKFLHGSSVLFGTRSQASIDYGQEQICDDDPGEICSVAPVRFQKFNPDTNAPLLDFVHATGIALTSPNIDMILGLVQGLMTTQQATLARNMGAIFAVNDVAQMHPEAVMAAQSDIWDDVIGVARDIAQEPGLLEDVVTTIGTMDPAQLRGLSQAFSAYAANRDRIEPDWSTKDTQNASLANRMLGLTVDRTRPDTVNLNSLEASDDNRSVFERFLHLVHDLDGVELCNKENAELHADLGFFGTFVYPEYPFGPPKRWARCELIRIPDAAVFYIKSIDGQAEIHMMDNGLLGWISSLQGTQNTQDSLIEGQSEITGFTTHPTPQAINRMVFQPDSRRTEFMSSLLDPPVTRDGLQVRNVHPATLFATELYGFYDNFRPLVQAFLRHGDRGAHLLVALLSAVHAHYPSDRAGQFQSTSPSAAFYNTMDGAVRYEPILVEAFGGDLLPSTGALAAALPSVDAGNGHDGIEAAVALGQMLLNPDALAGIAYRDGRTGTTESDGHSSVAHPSLYYLFADAFAGMDTAFDGNPAQLDSWKSARSAMVDTFLKVDGTGTSAHFHNTAIPVVTNIAVQWVLDQLNRHRALGDADAWARSLSSRLGTTTSGPTFAATIDFALDAYADPRMRASTGALLGYLLDDSGGGDATPFASTTTAVADLLQILRADSDVDPLLHGVAPAFQPREPSPAGGFVTEGAVPTVLRFLDRSRRYDTDHVFDSILANMASRPDQPLLIDEPMVVLGNGIAETHRTTPGAGGPMSPEDFQAVFRQVAEFLTDHTRGMEQFYYIVNHRRL